MEVGAPFVADGQPAEAVEPSECTLHHPAMTAELVAGVDAAPGDARLYAARPAGLSAAPVIIGFVGMQLVGACDSPPSGRAAYAGCRMLPKRAVVATPRSP